jgi:phage terminase small subunit
MKLTDKQNLFIQEYLTDLNATQAAIRAGYSEKTAQRIGSENLSKPVIKAEIERLQAETSTKLQVTKESLIKDLLTIKDLCLTDTRSIHNSIKAIDTINKMLGFNATEKLDVTTNGENINQIVWKEEKTYTKDEANKKADDSN